MKIYFSKNDEMKIESISKNLRNGNLMRVEIGIGIIVTINLKLKSKHEILKINY